MRQFFIGALVVAVCAFGAAVQDRNGNEGPKRVRGEMAGENPEQPFKERPNDSDRSVRARGNDVMPSEAKGPPERRTLRVLGKRPLADFEKSGPNRWIDVGIATALEDGHILIRLNAMPINFDGELKIVPREKE